MEVLCAIRFPTLSLDLMVPQPLLSGLFFEV